MTSNSLNEDKARKYLLGLLTDEEEMTRLEEKILTDDDAYQRLLILEEELIDDYLAKTLTRREVSQFERHFLATPERREKLEFSRLLRERFTRQATQPVPNKTGYFSSWLDFFRPPPRFAALKIAAVLLVAAGAGLAGWQLFVRDSTTERNLAALNRAYRDKRSVEARIVGFEYAPLTRGKSDAGAATTERDRAARMLLDAAVENRNAANLALLGKFYLAEREFEKAMETLEQAVKLAPGDAKINGDYGTALLESAKKAAADGDGAKNMERLDTALEHLEKAVALDPRQLEARFNRALCLQAMFLPAQAREAWEDYLKFDAVSPWADEARQNLKNLAAKHSRNRSADELERDFLAAFRAQDEAEAWQLLSYSRNLFREKHLPLRLAASYLDAAPDAQSELLEAMRYAGAVEKNRINDSFSAELAEFYAARGASEAARLKQAKTAIKAGFELALAVKFQAALAEFEKARRLFAQAGNIWEVKIAEFAVGNCLYFSEQMEKSSALFQAGVEFARTRSYKWLELLMTRWHSTSLLELKKLSEAIRVMKKSVALAESLQSSSLLQEHFRALAVQLAYTGQIGAALNYLQKVLQIAFESNTGSTQKSDNYAYAVEILSAAKLHRAAQAAALEDAKIVDEADDPTYVALSRIQLGESYSRAGDFEAARRWFDEGRDKTRRIEDETFRRRVEARCLMNLAHTERQTGNSAEAVRLYNQIVPYFESVNIPSLVYESQKGRLQAYLALGEDAELERQIPVTLDLSEKFREEILVEQERAAFFDGEQNIYDIAVDYEFRRGRHEQAYDYTEKSNARSLLDWLQRGAETSGDRLEILFDGNAKPLILAEIRAAMPAEAQILQFSVLPDRTLVWLITKEKFTVVSANIKADALGEKVAALQKSLSRPAQDKQAEIESLRRELFDLLIQPIYDELDKSRQICIVPHKSLFQLPFAVLAAANGKTFLADFELLYAPSANVFLICTARVKEKQAGAAEAVLSVGNPTFEAGNFDDLLNLPSAETEARDISGFYDNREILIGKQATKAAFLDAMKRAEVIHFAGHYVVVPNSPLASQLILAKSGKSDGADNLTNLELINHKLPRAKLVVLSACQTGVEHYFNGEGLVGLSRTFLVAGAPLVVASQWQVDSEATAELMKKFHHYRRRENLSTVSALRRAQLETAEASDGRFRQPFYWAAFAAYGGHADF